MLLGFLHVVPHEPEERETNDGVDDGPDAEAPSEADGLEDGVGCWSIAPGYDEPRRCGVCDPLRYCQS